MPRLGRRARAEMEPPIPWLELVLRAWEDFWWLVHHINRLLVATGGTALCSNRGSVLNAGRFRDCLLGIHDPERQRELYEFIPPADMKRSLSYEGGYPLALARWSVHSRRIYKLDSDLQALLQATSLKGVLWSDVQLPFDSFAIELAQPLIDSEGNRFGFLLVSTPLPYELEEDISPKDLIDFRCFGTKGMKYAPLNTQQRERIQTSVDRQIDRGDPYGILTEYRELASKPLDRVPTSSFKLHSHPDELVTETAERVYKEKFPGVDRPAALATWDAMTRLVVGLALYLKTLPPGSSHVSEPTKPFRSGLPDRKVITNRWEVCNVTSVIPLTREERIFYGVEGNQEEQRQAKYELSCHFREGHWRRPPGKGDDPTAPRTVHVRPCIVRRDRLPKDGGLPAGTVKGDLDT